MAELGWQETISFSFVDERWERDFAGNAAPIRVVNPIAPSHSVMRSSLVGSLVEVLRVNLARKQSRVRVFELGKVFVRDASAPGGPLGVAGVRQPLVLGGLAFGPAAPPQWGVARAKRRLLRRQGRPRSAARAGRRALRRRAASGAASRPQRRDRARRRAHRRHRRAASALAPVLRDRRATRSSSSSTPRRCSAARCRPSRRCRSSSRRGATSRSSSDATSPTRADGRDRRRRRERGARRDPVRHLRAAAAARPASPSASAAWPSASSCATTNARSPTSRSSAVVGAVVAALAQRLGARLRQQ